MLHHCEVFEVSEENKFEYMSIFESYVETVECYIERRLHGAIEGFSMEEFLMSIESRGEEEISGDLWELLLSFSDFMAFKDLILSYKEEFSAPLPEFFSSPAKHDL
jgi:ADP-ribosylation factor-like protein 2-binding protein